MRKHRRRKPRGPSTFGHELEATHGQNSAAAAQGAQRARSRHRMSGSEVDRAWASFAAEMSRHRGGRR